MILNQFLSKSGLCIDFYTWHPTLFLYLSLFSLAKYLRPIIRSSVLPLKGIHQQRHCRLPLNGTIAAYQFWRRQHYTIRQNQREGYLIVWTPFATKSKETPTQNGFESLESLKNCLFANYVHSPVCHSVRQGWQFPHVFAQNYFFGCALHYLMYSDRNSNRARD